MVPVVSDDFWWIVTLEKDHLCNALALSDVKEEKVLWFHFLSKHAKRLVLFIYQMRETTSFDIPP